MNSHRCRMRTSSATAAGERRWSAGAITKSPATRKRKARPLFAAALWLGVKSFILDKLRALLREIAPQQIPALTPQLVVSLAQRRYPNSLRIVHLSQLRNDGSRFRIADTLQRVSQ